MGTAVQKAGESRTVRQAGTRQHSYNPGQVTGICELYRRSFVATGAEFGIGSGICCELVGTYMEHHCRIPLTPCLQRNFFSFGGECREVYFSFFRPTARSFPRSTAAIKGSASSVFRPVSGWGSMGGAFLNFCADFQCTIERGFN